MITQLETKSLRRQLKKTDALAADPTTPEGIKQNALTMIPEMKAKRVARRDERLTEKLIANMPLPEKGKGKDSYIHYDQPSGKAVYTPCFGVCVTAGGSRSFILNYRINGRERRI